MREFKVKPTAAVIEGGYMARTMSKSFLASSPIMAWTQFFHKPYADDWKEAKEKAKRRCLRRAVDQDSIMVPGRS